MSSKDTLNKVKTLLGLEVKLEQMKLDNGTVLEAEMFEAGKDVFIVSNEEKVPLPVGEYVLENEMILLVTEEGIISEIKEAVAEDEAPVEDEPTEPEMAAEASPKKVVESISKEMFFSEIEKLRNEIAELKAEKTELAKEEVAELEVELSSDEAKPMVHNPEAKSERNLNLYAQKRAMTTKDRVFNKLFNN